MVWSIPPCVLRGSNPAGTRGVPDGAAASSRTRAYCRLVPRTRSSRTSCGKCDRELRVQRGTRIIGRKLGDANCVLGSTDVAVRHPPPRRSGNHLGRERTVRRGSQRCPQAPDVVAPSGHEIVALGVVALVSHAALAERQLMLRVDERSRHAGPSGIDAARPKHAIAGDVVILVRAYRSPDFARQLLADHPPLPDAAAPYRERQNQKE